MTKAMTTEEIIRQNANAPVGQSIVPIARSLARQTVFVATKSAPSTEPTTVMLDKLRLRTAQDNQGRMWAYAYTTQAELLRAFPQGSPYAELDFKGFFGIIERDGRFTGIFLNSGSDASYPIPRELFEKVKGILREPADEVVEIRRFPKGIRHFLMACIVPLVMSLMLSRWFLLLLLLPLTAAGMAALLHWRDKHSKCLRCGAPFHSTLLKCTACGLEYPVGLN